MPTDDHFEQSSWKPEFLRFAQALDLATDDRDIEAVKNEFFAKLGALNATRLGAAYLFLQINRASLEQGYGARFIVGGKTGALIETSVFQALWLVYGNRALKDINSPTIQMVVNALMEIDA